MMREYFNNPEATNRAIQDGWFATGDLVSVDSDGIIFFHGRSKDMIRRSGENIAAAEVEAVLSRHPDVSSVAVLGVADELRGEEVLAVIVPRNHSIITDRSAFSGFVADVRESLSTDVAPFKIPRYWLGADSLPLGASERVQKNQIDVQALWPGVIDTSLDKGRGR
jgi:crotonobetaine/carnitine-CoA ligase